MTLLQDRGGAALSRRARFRALLLALFIVSVVWLLAFGASDRVLGAFHSLLAATVGAERAMTQTVASYQALVLSKESLIASREALKEELVKREAILKERIVLEDENARLKAILGRIERPGQYRLAAVLSQPSSSLYGSVVIDAGKNQGVELNDLVYGTDESLVGNVVKVSDESALVSLFSAPGRALKVSLIPSNVSLDVEGLGSSGFAGTLPRDTNIATGTAVVLPGLTKRVLGYVVRVTFDPRDPMQSVFIETPSNLEELDWVLIAR